MATYRLQGTDIEVTGLHLDDVIRDKVQLYKKDGKDDAFYTVDLNHVVDQYQRWRRELPRVECFYAIKCNHDPMVIAMLRKMGAGFDCASMGEIQRALKVGTPRNKIVYANPCKQISHVRWARDHDVDMMTVDNEDELRKTKIHHPGAKLLVRIKPEQVPDTPGRLSLNLKFGIPLANVRPLLTLAKELGVTIAGVSFHVGTAEYPPDIIISFLQEARAALDIAKDLGFNPTILDIGGGFTGYDDAPYTFETICAAVRPTLDELFPESSGIRIIAEPGRYIVEQAFTITCSVFAKRILTENELPKVNGVVDQSTVRRMYYISCGVFHSFLSRTKCYVTSFRHIDVYNPEAFADQPRHKCLLWGPSMAPGDLVINGTVPLPELNIGDWVVFKDLGDYSICQFSNFGSLGFPEHFYFIDEEHLKWAESQTDDSI